MAGSDLSGAARGGGGEHDFDSEPTLGTTPEGLAANGAIVAMARAARACLMYDPTNATTLHFLGEYRLKMAQFLDFHGPMTLEIRPFEMTHGAQVIYQELDRERSLAHRLFRDGIRRVTFEEKCEWDELMSFLEILSMRYIGVRQVEEDIVTLLYKAAFEHITFVSLEGVVADEDDPEYTEEEIEYVPRVTVPRDWDLPLPPLGKGHPNALGRVPVKPEWVAALRQETSVEVMPHMAVRLALELLDLVDDPEDAFTCEDVVGYVEEVRELLLSEGHLQELVRMVRGLLSGSAARVAGMTATLQGLADTDSLLRILEAIPEGVTRAPEVLVELLDLLPRDHVPDLIDLYQDSDGEKTRPINRELIVHYSGERTKYIVSRLPGVEHESAVELLRSCADPVRERCLECATVLVESGNEPLQMELMELLAVAPPGGDTPRALLRLYGSNSEKVRVRAAQDLGRRQEAWTFATIVKDIQRRAPRRLKGAEAEAIGQALVLISPDEAADLFAQWVRPKKKLRQWVEMPGDGMLKWTAVSGLERIPGDRPGELISWLAKKARKELRAHCEAALRRREAGTSDADGEAEQHEGTVDD